MRRPPRGVFVLCRGSMTSIASVDQTMPAETAAPATVTKASAPAKDDSPAEAPPQTAADNNEQVTDAQKAEPQRHSSFSPAVPLTVATTPLKKPSAAVPSLVASPDIVAANMSAIANAKPMVQIAAVSRQEDADVLVTALRQRGYTVVVHNEPQDKLLHVQVGPFNDRAQATAMRQKLLADGYNAIIKQ